MNPRAFLMPFDLKRPVPPAICLAPAASARQEPAEVKRVIEDFLRVQTRACRARPASRRRHRSEQQPGALPGPGGLPAGRRPALGPHQRRRALPARGRLVDLRAGAGQGHRRLTSSPPDRWRAARSSPWATWRSAAATWPNCPPASSPRRPRPSASRSMSGSSPARSCAATACAPRRRCCRDRACGRLERQGLPGGHRRQGPQQRRRRPGRAGAHRLRPDPFRHRPERRVVEVSY
jgi:hypothetical protein